MKNSRRTAGFTLLELIVVIVIVGVLASVAVPSFARASERARVRDAQAVLAAIFSAERVYYLDENRYAGADPPTGNGTRNFLYTVNRYLTNPDAGDTNPDWNFTVVSPDAGVGFTGTATRTGGGNNGDTITVTQAFNGTAYGGTHPLRDQ